MAYIPDYLKTTRKTSNTKTLSGGERSYTTVSLLVAMWAVMSCPVVAVDEFDVFMVRAVLNDLH